MYIDETEAPRLRFAFRHLERDRRTCGAFLIHGLTLIETTLPLALERAHKLKADVIAFLDACAERGRAVRQASFGYDGGNLFILVKKQTVIGVVHSTITDVAAIEAQAAQVLDDTINATPPPRLPKPASTEAPVRLEIPFTPPALEPEPAMSHNRLTDTAGSHRQAVFVKPSIAVTNGNKPNTPPAKESIVLWPTFRPAFESLLSKVMGDAQATRMIDRELAKRGYDESYEFSSEELLGFGREILERIPNRVKRDALLEEMKTLL